MSHERHRAAIAFSRQAWADYQYWIQHDRPVARRIARLIEECLRNPFQGIGKPEPLKHDLAGYWSRPDHGGAPPRIPRNGRTVHCPPVSLPLLNQADRVAAGRSRRAEAERYRANARATLQKTSASSTGRLVDKGGSS